MIMPAGRLRTQEYYRAVAQFMAGEAATAGGVALPPPPGAPEDGGHHSSSHRHKDKDRCGVLVGRSGKAFPPSGCATRTC